MNDTIDQLDALLRSGARRLTGYQRRLFQAEVTVELCWTTTHRRRRSWSRSES